MNSEVITALTTLIVGILGGFFTGNYWKTRANSNNNSTKVELARISKSASDEAKWESKYNELKDELHCVSAEFRSFVTGLKVLFSAIMPQMSDRPDLVKSMGDFVAMVDKSDFSNKK